MKKYILLFFALILWTGAVQADSTFLPALEFHYLYEDNDFIFGTSKTGISEEDYLNFLLSDEHPLGEKVALISALASYFEWIEYDDNNDNDQEKYFSEYAGHFNNKILEKYAVESVYDRQIPPELRLLQILMDDYEKFSPDTGSYDRLTREMPQSLTMQSINVIAHAYLIVYHQIWDWVDVYEQEYQQPYMENWDSYTQDIHPDVHTRVEEWRHYMEPSPVDETLDDDDFVVVEEAE
jgi:hypothetical protein